MKKKRLRRQARNALLLLTIPTLVTVVVALGLLRWRLPTRVNVDLTVDRVSFTVGGAESAAILNSVAFSSITVKKFALIELTPAKLEVADPLQYVLGDDSYPESAWKPLTASRPVIFTPQDETLQPSLTFEVINRRAEAHAYGTLDRVWSGPDSEVTLELREAKTTTLTVSLDNRESAVTLSIHDPAYVTADYVATRGVAGSAYEADSLTYKTLLSPESSAVKITGGPTSVILILTLPLAVTKQPFAEGSIPITAVSFTRQGDMGNRETTIVREGEITYPDDPRVAKVKLVPADFIGLEQLEKFTIRDITVDPANKGIRLHLDGIAGHLTVGSSEFPTDLRLTCFEKLRENPTLTVLFSIIVWLFPTTLGGYRLYKDLKG